MDTPKIPECVNIPGTVCMQVRWDHTVNNVALALFHVIIVFISFLWEREGLESQSAVFTHDSRSLLDGTLVLNTWHLFSNRQLLHCS